MNGKLGNYVPTQPTIPPMLHIGSLKSPSQDIMVTELNNAYGKNVASNWATTTYSMNRVYSGKYVFQNADGSMNHGQNENFLFADGHVGTYSLSNFPALRETGDKLGGNYLNK